MMTMEEKRYEILRYCNCKENCTYEEKHPCPLYPFDCDHIDESNADHYFKLVSAMPDYKGPKEIEETPSAVNHPSHYNQGGIECWDAMEAAFGKEAVRTFCKLNAFKYVWRADSKNGLEDINKAINYLTKFKELTADEAV